MKGDFTRSTFDSKKHFLRVLMQQGRVQLDADWNEQASILLHYIQTLATDLIGPYAGPSGEGYGFAISTGDVGDFKIGKGRYYVNGILCENERDDVTYLSQADYLFPKNHAALPSGNYMVYLDVWERHISFVADDDIREKALNGIDTATRSKVVWQVKVYPLINDQYAYCNQGSSLLTDKVLALSKICISARAKQGQSVTMPCLTEPEAQYRGAENQLYRVEIHDSNFDIDSNGELIIRDKSKFPTFKFSRENGSVIFPIKNVKPDTASNTTLVELEHLGCDGKLGLAVDDWVEYIDDRIDLHDKAMPLVQVQIIDLINRTVTLSGAVNVNSDDLSKHPFLRRWDQKNANKVNTEGVIKIENNTWIKLEDGIEVKFSFNQDDPVRRGDYWLIPARYATGDVEWPILTDENGNFIKENNGNLIPLMLSPTGTLHRYAPLAIIKVDDRGGVYPQFDCRCSFDPQSSSCQYNYFGRLGIGTDLICPQDDQSNQ